MCVIGFWYNLFTNILYDYFPEGLYDLFTQILYDVSNIH
jgi:hypothetical protein